MQTHTQHDRNRRTQDKRTNTHKDIHMGKNMFTTCTCGHMCVLHMWAYVCAFRCTCGRMCVRLGVHVGVCVRVYVHNLPRQQHHEPSSYRSYLHVHARTLIHMNARMHTHKRTHTQTQAHTHKYFETPRRKQQQHGEPIES